MPGYSPDNPFAPKGGYSKENPFAPKDDFSDVSGGGSTSIKPKAKKSGSIFQQAAEGASLGFGDEIAGAISAMTGGTYKAGKADYQSRRENYKADNPGKSLAAEIGGGVASALPMGAASLAKPGMGLLARTGIGAAEGAGIGGIAGLGTAEGNLKQRLPGAAAGAVLGGVTGGALPLLGATGRLARSVIAPNTKGMAETQANRLLSKALERDQIAPQDLASRALGFEGKPAILPDLAGENTLGLARAAQATPSKAKDALAATLHDRAGAQLPRVAGDVEGALGLQRQDVHDLADKMIATRKANASPLYEEAYAHGVVKSDKIDMLLKRPAMKKALAAARITAKDEGTALPEGTVDVRTLDYVKRSLDDRISSLYRKGANDKARVLRGLRDSMLEDLDNAVPAFKAARQQFAGDSQMAEALDAGQNFLNSDPRLTDKALKEFTEGEKAMYRTGALDAVRQAMDKVGDNADLVKRIFGNTHRREQLRALLGDDETFNQLAEKMGAESRMVRTKDRILGGSPTARIESELNDMAGSNLGELAATGMDVARGNVPALLMRGGKAIMRRSTGNAGNVADILSGKMLTAPGTPEFDLLMQALAKQQVAGAKSATRGNVTRRVLSGGAGRLGSR